MRFTIRCASLQAASTDPKCRSESHSPKRPKRRHIKDAVSYTFETNGAGGIRTPVDPKAEPDFESGAFNRSATAPGALQL